MDWDPRFFERSPMLEPLREHAECLRGCAQWPSRAALQRLVTERGLHTASGLPLTLVEPANLPYERTIYERGEVQHRGCNWHDLFNALAWLRYSAAKTAINAAHYAALRSEREDAALTRERKAQADDAATPPRGRVRDALTIFDESGAIVVSSDSELLDDLRNFRWKRLFWERREDFRERVRVFVFGHALFEKALQPYVGMTAHALVVEVGGETYSRVGEAAMVDALAAGRIPTLDSPQALSPLPLLGVPGWWPDNEVESFYDNAAYFRAGRNPRTAGAA